LASLDILALNRFVYFLAMHGNLSRGVDAEPDFVAAYIDDGDNNVVTDDNTFVTLTA
jgi:hypothetical protein